MSEQGNKEKFYTVSARLVFSGIMVLLLVVLIVGLSIAINRGPILPILGVLGAQTKLAVSPIIVSVGCVLGLSYQCQNPSFNTTTGVLTVELSQKTGYNWTSVTVIFVPSNTPYSNGVPVLSWSPPQAVNVTGGLLSNASKYVNIPITSGPVGVGTNITGSIWAKYQLQVGEQVSYADLSSAHIVVKQ